MTRKILITVLSIFLIAPILRAEQEKHVKHKKVSDHDIKIGQSLFNGLIKQPGIPTINCASCHNVYLIDTFNWNPSALEIAISTAEMPMSEFKKSLLEPASEFLAEKHKNIQLTDDQVKNIYNYLGKLKDEGELKPKPIINQLIGFVFCVLLLLLSITDLLFVKKVKQKYIHGIILILTMGYIGKVLYEDSTSLGRQQFYEPDQPIKFSHKVHAGANQINCLYCHHTAEQSKSAGIPAMTLCLNCHAVVREGSHSGKFEIKKIDAAIVSGKPVEWVRIHNLPDHVYFNHSQHVAVGKLDCKECHGPVDQMDRIYQYNDLSMGWCLDCHRTKKVQFVDNKYYDVYKKFHEDLKSGKMDSVLVVDIGGQDCQKCHY